MAFWDLEGFSCLPPPNQHWLLFSHPCPLRTVHVLRAGSVSASGPGLHQDVRNGQWNEQSRVQEITEQNLKGAVFLMCSFNVCNKVKTMPYQLPAPLLCLLEATADRAVASHASCWRGVSFRLQTIDMTEG